MFDLFFAILTTSVLFQTVPPFHSVQKTDLLGFNDNQLILSADGTRVITQPSSSIRDWQLATVFGGGPTTPMPEIKKACRIGRVFIVRLNNETLLGWQRD